MPLFLTNLYTLDSRCLLSDIISVGTLKRARPGLYLLAYPPERNTACYLSVACATPVATAALAYLDSQMLHSEHLDLALDERQGFVDRLAEDIHHILAVQCLA